jgi:hypothetical protein
MLTHIFICLIVEDNYSVYCFLIVNAFKWRTVLKSLEDVHKGFEIPLKLPIFTPESSMEGIFGLNNGFKQIQFSTKKSQTPDTKGKACNGE